MSTGTITRLRGTRPVRRSTAASATLRVAEFSPISPRLSLLALAMANTAIAVSLLVLCLTLFL